MLVLLATIRLPPDMNSTAFIVDSIPTPVGNMRIVVDDQEQLRALDWDDYEARLHRLLARHYGPNTVTLVKASAARSVRDPIEAYLAGDLHAIARVRVQTGGTLFQRSVWSELRKIPVGRTLTYSQLAQRIGHPRAVRAVGLANGANPVGVVVPCHRVIGADGSLTGFGGGLHRKEWLLTHEGVLAPKQLSLVS